MKPNSATTPPEPHGNPHENPTRTAGAPARELHGNFMGTPREANKNSREKPDGNSTGTPRKPHDGLPWRLPCGSGGVRVELRGLQSRAVGVPAGAVRGVGGVPGSRPCCPSPPPPEHPPSICVPNLRPFPYPHPFGNLWGASFWQK